MVRKCGWLIGLTLAIALVVIFPNAKASADEDAWLGVVLQPLTDDLKEAMEIDPDIKGVLISDIIDDSPADEAGLEEGDVILEINGKGVKKVSSVVRAIRKLEPGDEVEIRIWRDGKEKVLTAELEERDEEDEWGIYMFGLPPLDLSDMPRVFKKFVHGGVWLGVRVVELNEGLAQYFDVKEGEGVLVIEVIDDSPAEEAGIEPGDVILKVDDRQVTSVPKFLKYIRKAEPGEKVEIVLKRKGKEKKVEVELEEEDFGGCMMMKFKLPDEHDIRMFRFREYELEDELEDLKDEIEELRQEIERLKET